MKIIEKAMTSKVILSDDEEYRYKLVRTWDERKPTATVIMLNPSKADVLKSDKTIMNLTNYLLERNYGALIAVNLFAYRTTDPKQLTQRTQEQEKYNNNYLIDAFDEADTIIVAWIRDKDKYVARKREVELLLYAYKDRVKCFKDKSGKILRHPRDLSEDWELVDYNFTFLNKN